MLKRKILFATVLSAVMILGAGCSQFQKLSSQVQDTVTLPTVAPLKVEATDITAEHYIVTGDEYRAMAEFKDRYAKAVFLLPDITPRKVDNDDLYTITPDEYHKLVRFKNRYDGVKARVKSLFEGIGNAKVATPAKEVPK